MFNVLKFSEGELKTTALFLGKYTAALSCTVLATIGATFGLAAGACRGFVVDCDNSLKDKEEGSAHYHTMSPINLLRSVKDIFITPSSDEMQARFNSSDPSNLSSGEELEPSDAESEGLAGDPEEPALSDDLGAQSNGADNKV